MAFSKSDLYPESDKHTSLYAKTLGHPARMAILRQLTREGPCTVVQLIKYHPISQPALSEHLRILRAARLVTWEEKFPHTYYQVDTRSLLKGSQMIISFFGEL